MKNSRFPCWPSQLVLLRQAQKGVNYTCLLWPHNKICLSPDLSLLGAIYLLVTPTWPVKNLAWSSQWKDKHVTRVRMLGATVLLHVLQKPVICECVYCKMCKECIKIPSWLSCWERVWEICILYANRYHLFWCCCLWA